jgi:cell division protein FtsL
MNQAVVRLFKLRVRGFSVVEALALFCLVVLVLAVYLFKTGAGVESAKINDLNRQIALEHREVRRLQAELSKLQQPSRIERLSQQYLGLAPAGAHQDASPQDLAEIARQGAQPGANHAAHPAEAH